MIKYHFTIGDKVTNHETVEDRATNCETVGDKLKHHKNASDYRNEVLEHIKQQWYRRKREREGGGILTDIR